MITLALASVSALPAPAAAPFAHHGPAVLTASSPAVLSPAQRLAKLAGRRALIVRRCAELRAGLRHATQPGDLAETFTPLPRQSLRAIEIDPLLSPAERARVRLDVEIARDGELWAIGRGSPCMWLAVVAEAQTGQPAAYNGPTGPDSPR